MSEFQRIAVAEEETQSVVGGPGATGADETRFFNWFMMLAVAATTI